LNNFVYIISEGIQDNFKFIMLGLAKEPSGWVSRQFAKDNVFDMSGRTSLGEMISIIRQCNVFLSCDTGPAHIAQACRVPTIVLFGPSNEREFGPVDRQMHKLILPSEDLKCRPCVLGPCIRRQSCIHLIDPDVVYQALKRKVIESQHIQGVQIFETRKQPQRQLCAI
jgi:ADP-heptose:LPS heptosyltransferase